MLRFGVIDPIAKLVYRNEKFLHIPSPVVGKEEGFQHPDYVVVMAKRAELEQKKDKEYLALREREEKHIQDREARYAAEEEAEREAERKANEEADRQTPSIVPTPTDAPPQVP